MKLAALAVALLVSTCCRHGEGGMQKRGPFINPGKRQLGASAAAHKRSKGECLECKLFLQSYRQCTYFFIRLQVSRLFISLILLTARVSFKECNLDPGLRQDCGFHGITYDQCRQRGCCYSETTTTGVPWCYHSKRELQ